MTNRSASPATAAPAPATDEELVAAIDRGLAVGTLVAFEDVDWDDLTGDETGPDHVDLIEQLDAERAAACPVCDTFPDGPAADRARAACPRR